MAISNLTITNNDVWQQIKPSHQSAKYLSHYLSTLSTYMLQMLLTYKY